MQLETAFGQLLRRYRENAELSQEALALGSGLDRTFVSALERGIRQPSLKSLFKIAKTLQISPAKIVSDLEDLITNPGKPN